MASSTTSRVRAARLVPASDGSGLIRWQQVNQINEPREITAVLTATANL